tara:strand:- start:32245 stop:32493 length:249 start_codon:yes stop_codon:yes gene_type:complete
MNENDLNYYLLGYGYIKTNLLKTIFYNNKSGRYIKVVRNCRSFGIWIGKKFLPLSKVEHQKEIDNSNMSDDLINLISELNKV